MSKEYRCECGKVFKSHQGLNGHYSYCLVHRKGVPFKVRCSHKNRKDYKPWNKGLSKENSDSLKRTSVALSKVMLGRKLSDKTKLKISAVVKGKSGGFRPNSNRWKGVQIEQNGMIIHLDSTYEKRFVEILNNHKIEWIRNTKSFEYLFEGSIRKYIPDFYLPSLDVWIEVKGWVKPIDFEKWRFFKFRLGVLFKSDLEILEKISNKNTLMSELDRRACLRDM